MKTTARVSQSFSINWKLSSRRFYSERGTLVPKMLIFSGLKSRAPTDMHPANSNLPRSRGLALKLDSCFNILRNLWGTCETTEITTNANLAPIFVIRQLKSTRGSVDHSAALKMLSFGSRKRPSLRMRVSSNQISPPPYSGRWMQTRSQWTAEWLPLGASS